MFNPKALLIDMDDTLFEERTYVESGFRAVAAFLEAEHDLPADYSFPSMLAFFELEGRGRVFDRIIERFEVRRADGQVNACIDHYRNHKPQIELYPGVRTCLEGLSQTFKLGLVSNGLPLMQQHKLDALAIAGLFNTVVLCDGIGAPKPSAEGILQAMTALGVSAEQTVMIGDNPDTDGAAATAAAVAFIRVKSERFVSIPWLGPEVAQFADVACLLQMPTDTGAVH